MHIALFVCLFVCLCVCVCVCVKLFIIFNGLINYESMEVCPVWCLVPSTPIPPPPPPATTTLLSLGLLTLLLPEIN